MDFIEEIDEIQEMLLAEARKIFSERVIEHFMNPRNLGEVENAQGKARFRGPCGDTMGISLRLEEDRISEVKFITNGCGPTIACGSMVTEMAKGKTLDEAELLTDEDLLGQLGGLPESHRHCATLAITTLRLSIIDCREDS